jgi:hypothetical protein
MLEVHNLKGSHVVRLCDMPGCVSRQDGSSHESGRRIASTELFAAGWPLGRYCKQHTPVMRRAWTDFGGEAA